MSSTAITYLVGACAAVFSLSAYVMWVLIPAWTAYTRLWERLAAAFLSLYVLLAFVGGGIAAGIGVIVLWGRLS
jgi:hypothetical protein